MNDDLEEICTCEIIKVTPLRKKTVRGQVTDRFYDQKYFIINNEVFIYFFYLWFCFIFLLIIIKFDKVI